MQGALQIIRFNWPRYVAAVATIAVVVVLMITGTFPPVVAAVLAIVGALVAWWCFASIGASYYIYDRSGAYEWRWLVDRIAAPRRYVNIHAGLDGSSAKLRRLFPAARGQTLNIYDPARMPEPSIRRAQTDAGTPADPLDLPIADTSCDTVFVLMAAHELRGSADRRGFFRELRRILVPGGQVVLVEHLRDVANFIAFGPGFTHFISRHEWRAVARDADLNIAAEASATPFVHLFLLRRSP